jgi:hypothetical protein
MLFSWVRPAVDGFRPTESTQMQDLQQTDARRCIAGCKVLLSPKGSWGMCGDENLGLSANYGPEAESAPRVRAGVETNSEPPLGRGWVGRQCAHDFVAAGPGQ